ncbi:hypothetical protein GDO86_016473 [Hymenochirus boettgeri]|uniref:Olfactory receptor n=1 Tax=Hymenochirus boettgeri TaxID=247094 RepID=A0A8T2K5I9_9PIPI|nr:hypothetical protein GDO86_016473 [Hymenochirus boettgeri]
MEQRNQTLVKEFILLAMTSVPYYQTVLFFIFLMLYLFMLIGNVSILTVVIMDRRLHIPMYFFLGNLSFLDIVLPSSTVPKMMAGLVTEDFKISVWGCITQIYFIHFFGCSESLFLTSMAYDRYVAICNPLRYNIVMGKSSCILLIFGSWLVSFFHSLTQTILTSQLPFCYLNHISHFFCDVKPLLKLACTDTSLNEILFTITTGFLTVSTSSLIFLSYCLISMHLLKIRSFKEIRKAFSTCTSHLTVVFFFYGPLISRFIRPATNDSMEQDRQIAVLYTIITPVLNPVIYALRNQEVKRSLKTIFGRDKGFHKSI